MILIPDASVRYVAGELQTLFPSARRGRRRWMRRITATVARSVRAQFADRAAPAGAGDEPTPGHQPRPFPTEQPSR
jgi:hypothetical protein